MNIREWIYNVLWKIALLFANLMRHVGIWSKISPFLVHLGHLLVPGMAKDTIAHLPGGGSIVIPQGTPSGRTLAMGLYEPEVVQLIQQKLAPGKIFVDVGANIGYFTLLASRCVGPFGKVYAFEPDPVAYKRLCANIARNNLENIEALSFAVASCSRQGYIHTPQPEHGYILEQKKEIDDDPVEMISLDDFFASHHERIHLMKMDIEGGELDALQGMKQLLKDNDEFSLIIEFNNMAMARAGYHVRDMLRLLHGIGFRHGTIIEKKNSTFSLSDGSIPSVFGDKYMVYNVLCEK